MRWLAALLLTTLPATTLPAAADTLIFQIWPSTRADQAVFCSLELVGGQFTAVEMKGMRMGTPLPQRWHGRPHEVDAMTRVMGDFLTGTLPSIPTMSSVLPPPPFSSATFWVPYDGGLQSGTLMLPGAPLPDALTDLIRLLLPGGLCDRATLP